MGAGGCGGAGGSALKSIVDDITVIGVPGGKPMTTGVKNDSLSSCSLVQDGVLYRTPKKPVTASDSDATRPRLASKPACT
jgi:hypothetical protein